MDDAAPSSKPKPPSQEEEASHVNWGMCMAIFFTSGVYNYKTYKPRHGTLPFPNPFAYTWMISHHFAVALQMKSKLKTFMESMLQKAGKIRGLVSDLKQNYSESNAMSG